MSRKKDEVRWTSETLAERQTERGFPVVELTGKALVTEVVRWVDKAKKKAAQGEAKADALGKRAAAAFAKWTPKTKLTVESAAMIASLLGATAEDNMIAPFLAYVLETRGADFAIQVTIAMWTMATNSSDRAVWLHAVDVGTTGAHDASVSYGKSDIVQFLRRVHDTREPMRAPLVAAVAAHYDAAPLPARPPLAVIVDDGVRGAALAKQFLADKGDVYPHWGWHQLPAIVRDVAIMRKLFAKLERYAWLGLLDTLGPRALEFYEASFARRGIDGRSRDRMLRELHNVHGPRTARIMTRYLMNKSNRDTVVAYFARYPELREDILADPACAEDHEYLVTYCKPS